MTKKKVLIIDDEADFCMLLEAFFSGKAFEFHKAYTLNRGMQMLEEIKPDIVFLDNNLPDGLGWEMATTIIKKYPTVELNLISAYQNNLISNSGSLSLRLWEKPVNLKELNKYLS